MSTGPIQRSGEPHEHALIGSVQPIRLVGPHRPRYIEPERGRGTGDEVDRCHTTLLHPYRSRVSARPTGSRCHDVHHCHSHCRRRTRTSTTLSSSTSSVPWPPPPLHHLRLTVCASYSLLLPLFPSVSLPLVVDQGWTTCLQLRMFSPYPICA